MSLRDDVTLVPLGFPYGRVAERMDRAWSDPTPLGGVARSEPLPAQGPTVAAAPCVLAHLGAEQRFVDLGSDAAALLDAATSRGTAEALELFGPEHRSAAAGLLDRALRTGLLVAAADD